MLRSLCVWLAALLICTSTLVAAETKRPNILLCIADDWGWPHAPAYGDKTIQTPGFDRVVREGAVFNYAYVSSPSCTPSRGALLTGQHFWRLEGAANLWSVFPDHFVTYPERLEKAGYFVGATGKNWGPGKAPRPLAGPMYKDFAAFMTQRPADKPFCFWLGSSLPHRPYKVGSGAKAGLDVDKVQVMSCLPNVATVRSDLADYYEAAHEFDDLVVKALATLKETGQLDNTLIVVTGDNGSPFPRGKGNIYDLGVHQPLAMRWSGKIKPGRTVDDFVSLTDLAPTFLEAAGLEPAGDMTGRSLMKVLVSEQSGRIDSARGQVFFGKERHTQCQEAPDTGGYPCRGVRTHDYLYIRNFTPDRWPVGTPDYAKASLPGSWLGDTDNGPSKMYLFENRDLDEAHRRSYALCFGKRPAEELYDLKKDPDQLNNVAGTPAYADTQRQMAEKLTAELKSTGDLRIAGRGEEYEKPPYLGGGQKMPAKKAQN